VIVSSTDIPILLKTYRGQGEALQPAAVLSLPWEAQGAWLRCQKGRCWMERCSAGHEGLSISPAKARKIRGLNKYILCAVATPNPAVAAGLAAAASHHFGHTSYLLKNRFFSSWKGQKNKQAETFLLR